MPGVREVAEAAADRTADVVPAPTAALVRSCAHDAWAPLLREHAYRSETVDLPQARALARRRRAASKPGRTRSGRRDTSNIRRCVEAHQEFVDYLLADGVQLRSNSTAVRARMRCCCAVPSVTLQHARSSQLPVRTAPDPLLADESAFTAEDETEDEDGDAVPRFPHVEAAINAAIARLGGAVLPKLNWSAPKARAALACLAPNRARDLAPCAHGVTRAGRGVGQHIGQPAVQQCGGGCAVAEELRRNCARPVLRVRAVRRRE